MVVSISTQLLGQRKEEIVGPKATFLTMPKYSIKIERITLQPDKFKPLSLAPVELEVIRFKRAKVGMLVVKEGEVSKFLAIIEFRGRIMTLTRSEGSCEAFTLGEILWSD